MTVDPHSIDMPHAANLMQTTSKSSWVWVKAMLYSIYDQPDADAVDI